MTLKEVQSRLISLKNKGFVFSRRSGSTGIGYTLEQELLLEENNLAIPDIGGRVELKATRKTSNSMLTLFTFNRAVWQIPQKELVENYGYLDETGRQSLYSTVFYSQPNLQSLKIKIDKPHHKVHLHHMDSGCLLATWSIYTIIGKFISKLEKLLIVFAINKKDVVSKKEVFLFDEAYLLTEPSPDCFLTAFEKSKIAIDIRMYLKDKGIVRNHGTGFRIKDKDLIHLYAKRKQIL